MPNVPEELLQSVLYVYPDLASAEAGERQGGTAFLFGEAPGAEPQQEPLSLYVVTARHNILKGATVLRMNKRSGGIEVVQTRVEDWHELPDADLAVYAIEPSQEHLEFSFVKASSLVTEEKLREETIGPGDDVFMIGRFVDHAGIQRNTPSLRFGNVSMMPGEPIQTDLVEIGPRFLTAFLVEMRSRGGFSGSPVFLYRSVVDTTETDAIVVNVISLSRPLLLGIDHGHFPSLLKIVGDDGRELRGWRLQEQSAMSIVIPAWRLSELWTSAKGVKGHELKGSE